MDHSVWRIHVQHCQGFKIMRWGVRRTLRLSIVCVPLLMLFYFLIQKRHVLPVEMSFTPNRFISDQFWKPFKLPGGSNRLKSISHPNEVRSKIIYFANPPSWFQQPIDHFKGCEASQCVLTMDSRQEQSADAVMFWAAGGLPRPSPRKEGQIWIVLNQESPVHSATFDGEWAGVFNWTMSYQADSDIFNPYGFLVYRPAPQNRDYLALAARKSRTVAWFVSNCDTPSRREGYVNELRKYIEVDVYGNCGERSCARAQNDQCLSMLNASYRFYLAFENSLCKDYVTEKFFHRFLPDTHVIPVVRGGMDYKKYFPAGTFINTADFQAPLHLAKYLAQLAQDPVSYASMLKHKDMFVLDDDKVKMFPRCELCRMLHQEKRAKRYSNIQEWVGKCWGPKDLGGALPTNESTKLLSYNMY